MGKSSKTSHSDRTGPLSGTGTFRFAAPEQRAGWRPWAAAILWVGLGVLILAPLPILVIDVAGEEPTADVRAPKTISVPDSEANAAAVERVQRNPEQIWTYQPGLKAKALDQLDSCFNLLLQWKPDTGSDIQMIAKEIYDKARIRLTNDELSALYRDANLHQLREDLREIVARTLDTKVIVGDEGFFATFRKQGQAVLAGVPPEFKERTQGEEPIGWPDGARRYFSTIAVKKYLPLPQDRQVVDIATKILMDVMGPNLEHDREATNLRKGERLRQISLAPVMKIYREGDLIAEEGDELTETQAAALRRVNAAWRAAYWNQFLGVILLAAACFSAVAFAIRRTRLPIGFTAANITMMCVPVLLAFGLGRFVLFNRIEVVPHAASVFFPSALVGMLAAIMVGPYVGSILVIVASVMFAVAMGQDVGFIALALFGGFTAVVSLQTIRERKDIWVAGFRVGIVNAAVAFFLSFFQYPWKPDGGELVGAFANGLACAFATSPLMWIFERAFGVVTDIRLLEITGPQHPLMRMMEDKAPGTYQHVLNVTKLAESAAEEIGANYLLVRTGAYFHDIGKALQPKYFTENQVTLDDKRAHSKLSPYMSTLIIKNHVKQGIELGKKHGLPQKVVDFIPQHHGTSLIRFFYNEAMRRYEESETTEVVREEDFRYPGPKPQSVEAGVVLLADSIEAIVTAKFTGTNVNENDLRRVVAQAVAERFSDGQFDECDLTMRDLFLIRESFVRTLKARFHSRIDYPQRREAARAETRGESHSRDRDRDRDTTGSYPLSVVER